VCELVKLGKSLAVGEVKLYSDGLPELVAHAVGTYAIPKK
jgi:acyl-coenzyme A thioesterase PaaI-like protein